MTFTLIDLLMLLGENWCWTLLGLKGLRYGLSARTKVVAIVGWWLLEETVWMEFSAQRFQQKKTSCMCLVNSINMHVHLFLLRCLYKYSWPKKDNQIGKGDDSHTCSNTESITTKDQWKLLLKDPNYSSYSVLALSPSRKVIACGNLQGNIKLQDTGE